MASKNRDNTCLLIISGKDKILIDVPGAIIKKLNRVCVDFKKISCIFFTHTHPDHIYGVVSLLHSQYRLNNTIHIYACQEAIRIVKILRKLFELEDATKYPKLIYHKIKIAKFYNSKNIRVSAFKVKHAKDSLGFRFYFKKKKISCVFSGDTAYSSKLLKQSKKVDYLIHDCFSPERYFRKYPLLYNMHTSSLTLGEIAKEARVKTLVPIHFAGEVKYSMSEIRKELKKNFKGRILIPRDFQILRLK